MDCFWLKAAHVAAVLIFIGGLFAQAIGVAAGANGETRTVHLVALWDQRVTLPAMLTTWLLSNIGGGEWPVLEPLALGEARLRRHAERFAWCPGGTSPSNTGRPSRSAK